MTGQFWYTIQNIDTLDTPALAIYPEQVKENIVILKTFVPDTSKLRPHVKTHKSPEITRLLMDAGIYKFKCATIAEAEMLAAVGATDVLLAYQPVGPKAERLAALVLKFPKTKFSCLIDTIGVAQHLSNVFSRQASSIDVYIDLNVGMNRTGIVPEEADTLFNAANSLKGLSLVGLHAYDGHLRDGDFALRTQNCDQAFNSVLQLANRLQLLTGQALTIIAGGTPTFPIHAKRIGVECSPGTFIYWDKGYQITLQEQPFLFAALVVTRVISKPTPGTICIDLGHKSIASENVLANRVTFLNAPDLEPVGHSEEHMILKTPNADAYAVGDVLYGVPYHICPTVALHDRAYIIENNTFVSHWHTLARNKTITL